MGSLNKVSMKQQTQQLGVGRTLPESYMLAFKMTADTNLLLNFKTTDENMSN